MALSGRSQGRTAAVLGLVALVVALAPLPVRADAVRRHQLLPGVEVVETFRRGPDLAVQVARVAPDARVRLRPVLAHDRIGDLSPGSRWEPTSEMCRRVGAIVCVNADFTRCPGCRPPFGGLVVDGRTLRSFQDGHEQISRTADGFTTDRLAWAGRLVARYRWRVPSPAAPLPGSDGKPKVRTQVREVPLVGLNAERDDGAVLYTPEWGAVSPAGGIELVLGTAEPVRAGVVAADLRDRRSAGGPIPADGAVVVGRGRSVETLDAFWHEWTTTDADERELVVATATSRRVASSVGGHPVLLRDGTAAPLDARDGKVSQRHPRTLLGWTSDGTLLLVTVDGRQPGHSDGLTLPEATGLLRELRAVGGINLDGGGSTTFVAACPGGPCVINRPSDGTERPVSVALAVVPEPGVSAAVRPMTPGNAPVTAAAAPPEADPASTAAPAPAPPPPVAPPPAPEPDRVAEPAATAPPPPPEPAAAPIDVAMTARHLPPVPARPQPVGAAPSSPTSRVPAVAAGVLLAAVALRTCAAVREALRPATGPGRRGAARARPTRRR